MRQSSMLLLLLVGAALLGLSASAHLWPRSPQACNPQMPRSVSPQKETLEAVALRRLPDYKHWTRANKEPHQIYSALDMSCQKETDYIFRSYLPEINERRWAKLNPKQAHLQKK